MLNAFAAKTFGSRVFWTISGQCNTIVYEIIRLGDTVQVTVSMFLSGIRWFYWYIDGAYTGKTTGPTKTFQIPAGEQFRLDVIPTDQEDFDPIANAPAGYSSRRTLWWVRSLSADTAYYRVDQSMDGGEWTTLALLPIETNQWDYSIITDRLDDLAEYTWRVVAIDAAGNESEPLLIGPEIVIRTPDAPNFSVFFDDETDMVTFASV